MMELPGYVNFEQISETPGSTLFKALAAQGEERVIVKVLKIKDPSVSDVARFKHEHELIRMAALEGVVQVREIIFIKGILAIVLEDFGAVSLKAYLSGSVTVEFFLSLAVRLTDTVNRLHHHNITHRNIKPANMFYNPEEDILKLGDFGIAAEIAGRQEQIYGKGVLEGALAYISPEQTGRMNCAVDYRTDFYALGISFYEMLTGGVPFAAKEPLEMIHAHIAKMPVPPDRINPHVPAAVSAIVMKLLAKSPEERYQSGAGLLIDLKACARHLTETGGIEPFAVGRNDVSPKFNLPQVLVGRKHELEILHQAFDRTGRGAVEVLMVSGEPGIGKSALIHEVHKPIVTKRGYFVAGKYDQLRQSVPYSGIIQAIQSLARQLLAENEARIEAWQKELTEALGPNGRIITDIIPEMELVIGKQPEIATLEPEEAQNRFKLVLKSFVRVIAAVDHPLVLFLDDLQWADPASIALIQTLVLDRDLQAFLLIGAYRDTEISAHHPLMLAIESMRASAANITAIGISALIVENVNHLLSNFLRCDIDHCRPLAEIIHEKTLGNPFFINQFLKRLYESGYFKIDAAIGWQWDATAIQKMQVTDNVVVFMAEKLRNLPAEPLTLIRIAACIGNRFDAETLAAVIEKTIGEVINMIDTLVQEGLITYKNKLYRFSHDRIHEAAYSLLTPDQKADWHFRIGSLVLKQADPEALAHQIFYVADQLNHSVELLQTEKERTRLAQINLKAGIKAKEGAAYNAAVSYLKAGKELLAGKAWQTDYQLAYDLYVELMECQYLARNFDEAERLFEIIVVNAKGIIDKANAYNIMIVLYTNIRAPMDAIALGLEGLKLFGIKLYVKVSSAKVLWELIKAKLKLRKLSPEDIVKLPVMATGERKAYHNLLFNIGTPAYFVNPNLFAFIVLRGINETLKYGLPTHAAVTFITVATILENVLGDYKLGYEIGKAALALNQKLDNQKLAGMVNHIFAFLIQHWSRHAKHDLPYYQKVYQLCLDHGNFIYAGHSVNASADCRLMIGEPLDGIAQENNKYRTLMDQVKDPFITGRYQENTQLIRTLKGMNPDPVSLTGQDFDEKDHISKLRKENNVYGLTFALLHKAKLLYLYGRFEEARKVAEELDLQIKAPMGTLIVSEHYFYYGLILAALLCFDQTRHQHKLRRIINRNQKKLLKWANLCPENFRHKYDLVQAELIAGGEEFWKAPLYYRAAIRGARQHQYLNDEALACERLALFYHRFDAHEEARVFMQLAHQCYGYWGAAAKQRELEQHYAMLLPEKKEMSQANCISPLHSGEKHYLKNFDLATVMMVSQALSGEIMLDHLLQKIMQLSLTNAGAQRGFLILKKEERLSIEVYEDPDQNMPKLSLPLAMTACDRLCHPIVLFVARSLKPIILANAAKEGDFCADPYVMRNQCRSILCMPILNKGKLSGIVYMENNLIANAFTSERLEILGMIASQASISLENARLFELATTDGLTKLIVHRYFHLLLDKEIERGLRYEHPFSLVMIDIDNFKKFNDAYGHQLGDEVLRRVGRLLRENMRSMDVAARYGGEEFVLILPEIDMQQALIACEKIRRLVEAMPIPFGQKTLNVTISMGVAVFPHHAMEKSALISSADSALYLSKSNGKNRVSVGDRKNTPHSCPIRPAQDHDVREL